MKEIWKDVVGYEGHYKVSSNGRVKSIKNKKKHKILSPALHRGGYLLVNLYKDKKQKMFYVHRTVLIAFVGHPNNKMQSCHNDGNQKNNKLCNLRWDTKSANELDKRIHGTVVRNYGVKNGQSKLNEKKAMKIYLSKQSTISLGKKYKVNQATISLIKRKLRWSHIHKERENAN